MDTGIDAMRSIIGIVLAGGQSSRMGRDKAMLRWNGQLLIDHQLAVLRAAGVDEVRVSGQRPDYGGIADAWPDTGPLGGLAGVAAELAGEGALLVIPVDMPLLTPALLQRLRITNRNASCLRYAGHVLPMRLRLDASCRVRLDDLLHEADPRRRSLRALQHVMDCEEIASLPDEAGQFADCNTEATWEAEPARLLAGQAAQNATCWPDGRVEQQCATLADRLDWRRDSDGWCVVLPESEVRTLAARLPSRDGLSWDMSVPGGEALHILFDVDVRDSTRKRHGKKGHDA